MPGKINMFLSNGNYTPQIQTKQINTASLGIVPSGISSMSAPKAPSSLKAPILSRVHNVRPGCGSCGRH